MAVPTGLGVRTERAATDDLGRRPEQCILQDKRRQEDFMRGSSAGRAERVEQIDTLVVFIVPLLPRFGSHVTNFINSYIAHPAEQTHDLLMVYKHDKVQEQLDKSEESIWADHPFISDCKKIKHIYTVHPNEGFDIGSYIDVAMSPLSQHYRHLVFVGSTTILHCDGWLKKLSECTEEPEGQGQSAGARPGRKVGVVGTSANLGSVVPRHPANVHVRSGPMFLVDRTAFAQCAFAPVKTKADGYRFEHGPDGLTVRMQRLGWSVVVARVIGPAYGLERCLLINYDHHDVIATDHHARLMLRVYEGDLRRARSSSMQLIVQGQRL